MEQESAASLLHFWMTAENFYNQLSGPRHVANMEDDMSDAITIYNRLLACICVYVVQCTPLQNHICMYTRGSWYNHGLLGEGNDA